MNKNKLMLTIALMTGVWIAQPAQASQNEVVLKPGSSVVLEANQPIRVTCNDEKFADLPACSFERKTDGYYYVYAGETLIAKLLFLTKVETQYSSVETTIEMAQKRGICR